MKGKVKMKFTTEEAEGIDSLIRRIAWSKRDTIKMNFEDVVSELWINALEIIEKKQEVDHNYIAAASFNKIVDLIRRNIRTEASCYNNEELDRCISIDTLNDSPSVRHQSSGSGNNVYTYCSNSSHMGRIEETVETLDILSLFDKDSKEYKFTKAWMELLGIIETKDVSSFPETCAYDRYVAVTILGYASSSSNGYARLRNKVREILRQNGYSNKA